MEALKEALLLKSTSLKVHQIKNIFLSDHQANPFYKTKADFSGGK